MDESDTIVEEIDQRTSFVLDISIRNLLDYNGYLRKYHDYPHYFEVIFGIIYLGEFFQIGPPFRKEL